MKACARCGERKPIDAFERCGRKGLHRRAVCAACRQRRHRDVGAFVVPRFRRKLSSKRYLVTSAQNATPVHEGFLASLRTAAKALSAELVVIPLRYRNPTSRTEERDDWWAPELAPYLYSERKKLHPRLVLVGDVRIQPTAVSPLSGFEALTGAESCILGHPKLQLRVVPAPSGRFPKLLTTTGAVTKRNYSESKAGALGEFHHHLGAVLVELDGPWFHLRQLNADRDTGAFYDLDKRYTPTGVEPAPPALGLVFGDLHARFVDPKVEKATFGKGGMLEVLDPDAAVFHDLHDGYAVNPHHHGNPFVAAAKSRARLGDVRDEVLHAVQWVGKRCRGRKAYVVASNHDDFLARWVRSADWRHMGPANADFYLETAQALLRSAKMTPSGAEYDDAFAYWVDRLKGDADIKALRRNESLVIGGVECSLHGHVGSNGARPSRKGFARLGVKTIVGHSHTPGIEEGSYAVGTSTPLKLEYSSGPSSWLNTHCVIYANGARSLLTVIDGRWRA